MIPLPPPDANLPELAIAFDGEAMAELLALSLRDCASARFTVDSCRPRYVRYKPGTNCIVQYALGLRGEASSAIELPAHVSLYADDRGQRRWGKPKLQAVVAAAKRLHAPPFGGAAYLPAVRGVVSLFPVDYTLPALVDIASNAFRITLQSVLPEGVGRIADSSPTLVRYKPARKALLRFEGEDGRDAIYAKALCDDRGESVTAAGRALLANGIATAAPLACLRAARVVVHASAPGVPLSDLETVLHALCPWMEPTAAVLAALHAADVPGLPGHVLADEASDMRELARTLGILVPSLASRLERLTSALADALTALPDEAVPLHGDFYTDQVLVSERGVVLIDLDEMRRGHPLLDVGMFLAHLAASTSDDAGQVEAGEVFREAYARERPRGSNAVPIFEAAALLRKAPGPFRRLEPDWPQRIERLVVLAERCLAPSHAGRPTPVSGGRHANGFVYDPALPQLRSLVDAEAMSRVFRSLWNGKPISVQNIDVVRHKPGRRCLLRYEVGAGGQRRRLYGKTFASERGPRVYEITRTLTEARAFGSDVLLPKPVAFMPHLKLLVQPELPGEPVAPRLLTGDTALARQMAEALHALHRSGLDLGRRRALDDELDHLRDRVEQSAERAPELAAAARRCLDIVQTHRPPDEVWRWHPCHRDCYHDQFLIGPAGLAVLDLDDAAMAEPALDVANVLAHLRLLGLQQRDDADALDDVATAFRDAACRLDPELNRELLRFLEAATLLRLAVIHLPRNRGNWLAARLLEEAQSLLVAAAR